MPRPNPFAAVLFAAVAALSLGGCPDEIELEDILEDIEINIGGHVDEFQTIDPRFGPRPVDLDSRGDTIIIEENTTIIVDISEQLVVEELPDITLLGFENLTGFDLYLSYFVDGVEQGILVYDGETLFLEYEPCVFELELGFEDHFDVATGVFVESFDLQGTFFDEGIDYFCGDALILTFDEFDIFVTVEPLE